MKLSGYKALLISVLLLAGCDVPSPAQSAGPYYSLQENGKYGYEMQSGQVMMLAYLGQHDGLFQFSERRNDYLSLVYECAAQCEFYKAYQVDNSNGNVIAVERYRNNQDSIIAAALLDAGAGYLQPYLREQDGKQYYLWTTEQGADWHPVAKTEK